MLFSANKNVVGLDLDHGEIRAMELRRNKGGLQLLNVGRAPLPPDALDEGMILQRHVVSDVLARLWQEQAFTSRDVVLGVSNNDVLVRFTEFPVVPRDKLEPMIRYHIKDLLPISLGDAIMDFSVTGPAAADKDKMQEVLLVATQRAMINNFMEALKKARLNPLDINVVSLVLQNLMPPAGIEGAVIMLDLAYGSSTILVTVAGIPRLARRLTSRLQDVATNLYCSLDEVVATSGAAPGEVFPDAFIDWGETLVGEIRASINYYQSQGDVQPVTQMIMSGCGASIAGFAGQLQEIFDIPVVVVDLLQFLEKKPPESLLSQAASADYALSFALARGALGGV